MDSPRPTMQDVARVAGVHQTTVSRALRNDHRLPEPTRERIKALAEKLGYRANPLVSALVVARRSRHPPAYEAALAFVVRQDKDAPSLSGRVLESRRDYLRGARDAAARLGFKVEEFVVGTAGLSEERLNTILTTRNIHGLILAPLPTAHGHFTLDWSRFCMVVIEYTFTDPRFDRVVHDSYDGMRRIMRECQRRGLLRVGLTMSVLGHERTERTNGAAYWSEQKADGTFPEIPPLILMAWDEVRFAEWVRKHNPEVIVTSNDFLRLVREWCESRKLELGHDISLINVNATSDGDVDGVFQNPVGLGATAARMVIEKIMHNEWGVPARRQTVMTSGVWIEGHTLKSGGLTAATETVAS